MEGDVGAGGVGPLPQGYQVFREWLLAALRWNPNNPRYFCADVQALAGTFPISNNSWDATNRSTNQALSVIYWIIHNPLCDNYYDHKYYTNGRGSQREAWENTQDTSKVPLDTTIYSMHDLGLDSVLKYAAMLGVHSGNGETIISSALASPNPVGEGTVIIFGTSREAFVRIELFDLLGNAVSSNGFEGVVESGTHSVPISTHNLAAGMYYARISTTYGEVQTVKLVKE